VIYKNKVTGAILDSPFVIFGGDWIEDKQDQELDDDAVVEDLVVEEIEEKAPSLTKGDIMKELDAFGIKYNPKAKKEDLYKLMMEV